MPVEQLADAWPGEEPGVGLLQGGHQGGLQGLRVEAAAHRRRRRAPDYRDQTGGKDRLGESV